MLAIISTSNLNVVKSEEGETWPTTTTSKDNEVCVRLCCNESNTANISSDSDCFNLKLMPEIRNLNFEFKTFKRKLVCPGHKFEYEEIDPWIFLPVIDLA